MPIPVAVNPPKEEGRFGFGTTEAVDALLKRMHMTTDMTALVAINVNTLIRNAVSTKTVKAQDVVDKVRATMNGVATEIAAICADKWKHKQHNIVYYFVNSDRVVPEQYQRPKGSATAVLIEAATSLFSKTVKPNQQTVGNCTAHFVANEQLRIPSYKGLRDVLDKIATSDVDLQLISHFPMDYHVTIGTSRKGTLYRSHTGEQVPITPSDMGRVVFKNEWMPFYPCTHVLFGDKYLIKTCIDRETKKKLDTLAQNNHWAMHTNTYIYAKLKDTAITLPYSLD